MKNYTQEGQPMPIDDPQVDPQEIMAEIRSQLIESRYSSLDERRKKPVFTPGTYPQKPHDITYDLELYQLLDDLEKEHSQIGTKLDMQESRLGRLPIFGRFWRSLQRALHGPAHYYANRTAERQAQINSQMFQILSKLMAANQERQREISRLKNELNELRGEDR